MEEVIQSFKSAALEAGFVEANHSPDGSVYWLKKTAQYAGALTHESLCIDTLTNSATAYWTCAPGRYTVSLWR